MIFSDIHLLGVYVSPVSVMMIGAWLFVVVLRRIAYRLDFLRVGSPRTADPVRVHIDDPSPDLVLVAGMTAKWRLTGAAVARNPSELVDRGAARGRRSATNAAPEAVVQLLMNASRSGLITSACVVHIPCG